MVVYQVYYRVGPLFRGVPLVRVVQSDYIAFEVCRGPMF